MGFPKVEKRKFIRNKRLITNPGRTGEKTGLQKLPAMIMTNFSEIIQASIDAAYDRASIEADRLVRQELQAFHQRLEERVLPNDPDYYAHNPVGIEISESQIIEEVRDRHFIDLFVGELMEEGFGYSESHEIALE